MESNSAAFYKGTLKLFSKRSNKIKYNNQIKIELPLQNSNAKQYILCTEPQVI